MIERYKRSSLIAAALAVLNMQLALPSIADEAVTGGCVLRSIELDDQGREVLLRILTDGDPTSIGARVKPEKGVVLDLYGCAPGSRLSREVTSGLVSALRLYHGTLAQDSTTAVVVDVRGAFEYSVSNQPGTVLVRLSAKDSQGAAGVEPGRERVRVLEPLPVSVAPRPPLPVLPPPAPRPQPPADDPETSLIANVVADWARGWSEQRIEDYLAAYAMGFQPPSGLSRSAWEAQRRSRIAAPAWIEIELDDLQVRLVEPGWAVAAFSQSYRSDTYKDQVDKALNLIQEDGRWKILLEEIGRLEDSIPAAPVRDVSDVSPATATESRGDATEPSSRTQAVGNALVEGARISVRKAPAYDVSYRFIPYPGGDPGWQRGSGVDVVIRAYRHHGIDLQQRVHEDIVAAAADYGVGLPDTNIDHRRVRNLRLFMRRRGHELGVGATADWRPGDIVFWAVGGRRSPDHLGIISDRQNLDGRPLVIHHSAANGTPTEEDVLFAWTVRGHYRWLPVAAAE